MGHSATITQDTPQTETRTLTAGTVIRVHGIELTLKADVAVEATTPNWRALDGFGGRKVTMHGTLGDGRVEPENQPGDVLDI